MRPLDYEFFNRDPDHAPRYLTGAPLSIPKKTPKLQTTQPGKENKIYYWVCYNCYLPTRTGIRTPFPILAIGFFFDLFCFLLRFALSLSSCSRATTPTTPISCYKVHRYVGGMLCTTCLSNNLCRLCCHSQNKGEAKTLTLVQRWSPLPLLFLRSSSTFFTFLSSTFPITFLLRTRQRFSESPPYFAFLTHSYPPLLGDRI